MKTKPRKKQKQRANDGYWSARKGLCEFTTEDRMEVERRTAEILEARRAHPPSISGIYHHRHSTAIRRCVGNGARRGGFPVTRD